MIATFTIQFDGESETILVQIGQQKGVVSIGVGEEPDEWVVDVLVDSPEDMHFLVPGNQTHEVTIREG